METYFFFTYTYFYFYSEILQSKYREGNRTDTFSLLFPQNTDSSIYFDFGLSFRASDWRFLRILNMLLNY